MNIAFLSALFALAGSVIGGLTSGVTTWLGLRVQTRAGQLALEMSRRDDLTGISSSRHRKPMAMQC
jgi:hypothetical protein